MRLITSILPQYLEICQCIRGKRYCLRTIGKKIQFGSGMTHW